MKIGIISDTHDDCINVKKAVDVFNKNQVKYIFHAGDMVSPSTAAEFAQAQSSTLVAVLGNCDNKQMDLRKAIESFDGRLHGRIYCGQVGGRRIYMSHSLPSLTEATQNGKYDLVIYGHTHKQDICRLGNLLIINPGSAKDHNGAAGSVVILDTDDMSYEVVPIG